MFGNCNALRSCRTVLRQPGEGREGCEVVAPRLPTLYTHLQHANNTTIHCFQSRSDQVHDNKLLKMCIVHPDRLHLLPFRAHNLFNTPATSQASSYSSSSSTHFPSFRIKRSASTLPAIRSSYPLGVVLRDCARNSSSLVAFRRTLSLYGRNISSSLSNPS